MDAAARTAHDSTLQPFSEMEHYKHADELPPEIMADSYDKLERLCLKYMNEDDFSKVEQAYCFAAEKHCNQKRRSGEMYINHPVEVAIILADLKMDCTIPSRIPRPRSPMCPACLAIRLPSSSMA